MSARSTPAAPSAFFARRRRNYRRFIMPAVFVVGAVIIFPWLFTVWMSAFDWKIGSVAHFVGFDNYVNLATNQRFLESIGHTFYFTLLAVVLPLVPPFLVVAAVIRTIDAVKAFDTIYVISQGGPGTASETINLYLYLQAFAFYNVGNASAVVVVFFAIILALALLLLHVRQKTKWAAV